MSDAVSSYIDAVVTAARIRACLDLVLEARRLEWLEIYRRQRLAVQIWSHDFVLCWFKPFRRGERWFLHRWRVGWDKQQRGIVIETPVCRLEVVKCWIPF